MKLCLSCNRLHDGSQWECPACGNAPAESQGFLAFAPELAAQNDGFNPQFFQLMAAVEPRHFWFVMRNRILTGVMRKYFPGPDKILEIGCGTGFVLTGIHAAFPQASLSGSDIFTEGLSFAARRVPNAFLFQMDARHIPFRDEFDVIGAFDVLEHVEQDEAVLAQMYQACKAGGGIVVSVPQHRWLWSPSDDYAHHKRRYVRQELHDKVTRAGFKVEYMTSFVALLLPLMMVARARPKSGNGMEQQMEGTGLKIGPLTNAVLGLIMRIEWIFIKVGLSFPAGGSLLLVAKKP